MIYLSTASSSRGEGARFQAGGYKLEATIKPHTVEVLSPPCVQTGDLVARLMLLNQ